MGNTGAFEEIDPEREAHNEAGELHNFIVLWSKAILEGLCCVFDKTFDSK